MYIRCATCHGSVWVEMDDGSGGCLEAACKKCGQAYRLNTGQERQQTGESAYREAQKHALEHGIDLPGAYSVILGIMTLEQVQDLNGLGPLNPPPESLGPDDDSLRKAHCDPAFLEAIEAGHLTQLQAFHRGNRERFATRLAKRHQLSEELAYAVTDNRISLLNAIDQREGRGTITVDLQPVKVGPPSKILIAALLVVTVLYFGESFWNGLNPVNDSDQPALLAQEIPNLAGVDTGQAPQHTTAAALRAATEVVADTDGKPARIVGPDPRSILIAYCESVGNGQLFEPVDITPAVPPSSETRLGVFRNLANLDALLAIPIRRDRASHRWFAGSGTPPIRVILAPPAALSHLGDKELISTDAPG